MKSFDLSKISRSLSFNHKQGSYPDTDSELFHTSIKPSQSDANTTHTTCAKSKSLIAASCNKAQSAPVSPQLQSAIKPWPELDLEIPGLVADSSSRDTSLSRIKSHDHLEVPLSHNHLHPVGTIDEDQESMLSLSPAYPHQYPMPVKGDLRCGSFMSRDSRESRDYPCYHEPVFDVEFDNSSPLEGINPLNRVAHDSMGDHHSVNLGPIKSRPEIKPLQHASTFTEDLVRFPSELVKLPNKINKKVKRGSKLIKRPTVQIHVNELDSELELERFETATNTACVENVESATSRKTQKKIDKKKSFNRMVMRVIRPFKSREVHTN